MSLTSVTGPLKAAHADLVHRWRWRRTPIPRIGRRFAASHGLTVQSGPLTGMEFPAFAVGRAEMLVAQLLGAYERELHPALERVVDAEFPTIIDIGASDGYYAVGLARACRSSRVFAYEMNPLPAQVCRRLAQTNGVQDRVIVRDECTLADLRSPPADGPTFVLCDVEGAEDELMDPDAAPILREATLIVELHDFAAPGIEERIVDRFRGSHEIEFVRGQRRWLSDYPQLDDVAGLTYIDREVALSEFRHSPIAWAVMTPRATGAG
jgi:hypothetical protein